MNKAEYLVFSGEGLYDDENVKLSCKVRDLYVDALKEQVAKYNKVMDVNTMCFDARLRCFDKIYDALYVFQLDYSFVCGIHNKDNLAVMLKPFGYPKENFEGDYLNTLVRVKCAQINFLLFHCCFASIESSFRIFIRELYTDTDNTVGKGIKDGTADYKCIYSALLKKLNLTGEYANMFKLLGILRNSIHNKSVYYPYGDKPTEKIKYKGREYVFKRGEQVEFATLEFILNILIDVREFWLKVVNSEKISSKKFIEDKFL